MIFSISINGNLVETDDTALSAKHIHQHKSKHIAAIASKLAADLFDLNIIAPNIHTLKNNYTRFLVLQPKTAAQPVDGANKASVNFHTDHSRGSLAKVLTKNCGRWDQFKQAAKLSDPGSDFKYSFHADMEFDSIWQFEKVIEEVKGITEQLKIYGVYQRGKDSVTL
jgi:prephenate dehydratase